MKSYGGSYLSSAELRQLGCRSVGEDVTVHSTCVLVGLENISFGNHVRIDGFSTLTAAGGFVTVADHVHISSHAFLSGPEGIEICEFVNLSAGVRLYSRNDDFTGRTLTGPTVPEFYRKVQRGRITLGRHVIVGSGSVVLPGVEIAEGTTVGALSLVKSNLEPWGIYAGVPVRRLRDRDRKVLELEAHFRSREIPQD